MTTLTLRRPRRPTSVLKQILSAGQERFGDDADPVELLRWFNDQLGTDRIAVATSFADSVLACLAGRAMPGVDLLFLDTGYHFPETLGLRDAVEVTEQVNVRSVRPAQSVAEQDRDYGPDLWHRDPDLCCKLRKQQPMAEALHGYEAWVTGLRRADHPGRSGVRLLDWDHKHNLIKINPLAAFSDEQVAACEQAYGLLQNPLTDLGYVSIGCQPCTKPVADGEDPRASRWAHSAKTECGLHL